VDLHSQWESIAFLDANIIGSGSATMIGSLPRTSVRRWVWRASV
jgi:hypothetical protein